MRGKLASKVRKTLRDIMNCMRLHATYMASRFSTPTLIQKLVMDSLRMCLEQDQKLWSK